MSERLADHLIQVSIFAGLTPEELYSIEKYMFFSKVEPNDFVFREGEKGDYVCFVAMGTLEVIKFNNNSQPVVINTLTKGGSIGEMALIDKLTRSASVRARTPSSLIVLTRKGFDLILKLHPEIGIKILKGVALLLSTNLRKTSDKLAEFMPPLA
ncbi:MAG TPA: cyclic nucleotide-binding domain-containing protein [Moraxellaceae bacterium]|nr:cyclic nucleotide-binding domain-containing protein [Moraxellaceae bacterium]